jgi:hypothetical protein
MTMEPVLLKLTEAQNNFDAIAYANCFTENAIVHDEGKTHKGRVAIRQWIEAANKKYRATMKPLKFTVDKHEQLLTAETSGNFPGSPAVLTYHLQFEDGLISALEITG